MNLVSTIASFLVALGILIVVHELGHYLVARWCGVKVLRFSLGFGKPLFKRRYGADQTEWVLAAIPFGGYVSMLDEREHAAAPIAPQDLPRAFNRQPVAKRIAIVAAGPLMNFLLAILIYTGLNIHGVEEPIAFVAAPPAGTVAARAGVTGGAKVLSIGGEQVDSFVDLRWRLLQAGVDREPAVRLELQDASGSVHTATLDFSGLAAADLEADFLRRVGLLPGAPQAVIGEVAAGSSAARAGLQRGDRVVAIDGRPVAGPDALVRTVRSSPGRVLQFDVLRGKQELRVEVVPEAVLGAAGAEAGASAAADPSATSATPPAANRSATPSATPEGTTGATAATQATASPGNGRIGAAVRAAFPLTTVRHGPVDSLWRATTQTWDATIFSLRMLGKMITGQVSVKNLSGPVTIADYAGQSARMGAAMYLTFLAFISISIGLMNLLPIPLLDGGHLLYYLVEILLGRAPSERIMEWGQRAGMAVLASLMVLALFNDFARLLS